MQKARRLRTYAVAVDGTMKAVSSLVSPDRACSVELTEVVARGQTWWTLGLEAVGEEDRLVDILNDVARFVLGQGCVPTLDTVSAYGYPRWLQLLVA